MITRKEVEQDSYSQYANGRTKHRSITGRVVVTGELALETPAQFGNGDVSSLTDLPLLMDELKGHALLTGTSLAGALRNYLREFELGYEVPLPSLNSNAHTLEKERDLLATVLFGGHRGDIEGSQSPLIVDDALSVKLGRPLTELRDGVAICPRTRTASGQKKFDYELLPAGTRFTLRFELLLTGNEAEESRRKLALALALRGLSNGEIGLGAKKRRGLGRCRVHQWSVIHYNLTDPSDLMSWLAEDHPGWGFQPGSSSSGPDLAALLGVDLKDSPPEDRRELLEIDATFAVAGSLLVRSGFAERDRLGPDAVHLYTSPGDGESPKPVMPGTGLAGALRQRALRIVNTLAGEANQCSADTFINKLFGPAEIKSGDTPWASRVIVAENFLQGGHTLVQSRVKIDRFTGGAADTALFDEAPYFFGEVALNLRLLNPCPEEIGLLLLLLKDLWLEDLPLGGESGVGRGRLKGQKAKLQFTGKPVIELEAGADEGEVIITGIVPDELQNCVDKLNQKDWARTDNDQ